MLKLEEGRTYCENCPFAVWDNDECIYQCGNALTLELNCLKYDLTKIRVVPQD